MRRRGWVWEKLPEVGMRARARLDRYGEAVPEYAPGRMPFNRYMAVAAEIAVRDPSFAAELRRALGELERVRREVGNA